MTIGKRISELRKAKGYTQEYVAAQLGVSRQAVSKWEQDQTSPDTRNLIALSQLLGSSVEYLAVGEATGDTAKENSKRAFKAEYFVTDLMLPAGFIGFFLLSLFGLQEWGLLCLFGCTTAGYLINRKGRKLEKEHDQQYGETPASDSDRHRVDLHNIYVTCATFLLLIGIALTLAFPYIGPYFIVASIVFMVLAASVE